MAGEIMITVKHGDEEIQVPIPKEVLRAEDVAKDYMLKNTFESELGRRAMGIAEGKGFRKPDDLLTDKEHVAKIMEQNQLVKKGSKAEGEPKPPTPEMIAELQTTWRAAEVEPLQTQVDEGKTRTSTLLGRMKASEIVAAAAAAGVKERFLNPSAPGQEAPIVSMLSSLFRFDGEHNEYFVSKNPETFEITSDPKALLPYKTISEYVVGWAALADNKDFVDVNAQTGPNLGTPGVTTTGKDVTITREQAEDFATYEKAQVAADKLGGRVIVSGTPVYGATAGGV